MKINCKASHYSYRIDNGDKAVVYNTLFDSKFPLLLLSAIADVLLPDITSFDVPISISIEADENAYVVIDKKLNVTGARTIKKYILSTHYSKWKKTYLPMNYIYISFGAFLSLFLLYIFVAKSGLSLLMGLCALTVILLTIMLCIRLKKNLEMVKVIPIVS